MLYTTYFGNLSKLPKKAKKLIITRYPPQWIYPNKLSNTYVVKELSPSKNILIDYKKSNDWENYRKQFIKEMNERKDLREMLSKLESFLKQGNDVYLLCYEKDYTTCHRSIIAKHLEERNIEWIEWRNPNSFSMLDIIDEENSN